MSTSLNSVTVQHHPLGLARRCRLGEEQVRARQRMEILVHAQVNIALPPMIHARLMTRGVIRTLFRFAEAHDHVALQSD